VLTPAGVWQRWRGVVSSLEARLNWPDEPWRKIYTRDTANWLLMPWQARAVLALMIRKVDTTGIAETGQQAKYRALAAILMLPIDVVEPGIKALVELGTVAELPGGFELTKFMEAQESRTSDPQRKKASRDRHKAKMLKEQAPPVTAVAPPVTAGEDQIRREEKRSEEKRSSEQLTLDGKPDQPKKRQASEAQQIFEDLEAWRVARCEELGLFPGETKPPPAAQLNSKIAAIWEATGLTDDPEDAELTRAVQLTEAFRIFLLDDFGRVDQHGALRDTPWPINLFMVVKVAAGYVRQRAADREPWRPAELRGEGSPS
jgi:hypothetical protein